MKAAAIAVSLAVFLSGAVLAGESTTNGSTQKKSSSAATPATPSQGTGTGATPATPSPKASEKALETPSRNKDATDEKQGKAKGKTATDTTNDKEAKGNGKKAKESTTTTK